MIIIRLYISIFVFADKCLKSIIRRSIFSLVLIRLLITSLELWLVPPVLRNLFLPGLWPWLIYKILPMQNWVRLSFFEFQLIKPWKCTIMSVLNVCDISVHKWVVVLITSLISHFFDIFDTITIFISD